MHAAHTASEVAVHAAVLYVPAAHTVHVWAAAAPPAQNEPAGQAVTTPLSE